MRFLKLFSSPLMFTALLGLFFLPFLEVKCDREVWIEATGIQLMTDYATFHQLEDFPELATTSTSREPHHRKQCKKRKRKHCSAEASRSCHAHHEERQTRACHSHTLHRGCQAPTDKQMTETVAAKTHLDNGLGAQGFMGLAFLCGLFGLVVSFGRTRRGALLRGSAAALGLGTMGYFWATYQGFWNKGDASGTEFVVAYQPAFYLVMGLFLILALQAFWVWKHWPAVAHEDNPDAWDRYTDDQEGGDQV